jgi:hypothetical protein
MGQLLIQQTLNRVGIDGTLQFTRTLTSAVTTAWGVDWDEVYIARDLMQNFFDANREQLEAVLVRNEGSDVVITAPAPFNLERLFYLGSEKGDNDIGQYGEGFKVAATCLLRDHEVTPIAASGGNVVVLRVADRVVPDTRMFPVEYDFYHSNREVPGTVLVLPGCSGKLVKALKEGLTHFFYEKNPLLGAKRWSKDGDQFSIYDSTDSRGHVFYRKLKRGEIDGIPVVLVIDKQYQGIERKISRDRDRNAFGEEIMTLFYNHFARYGLKWETDGQRAVVVAAQSCWERGHPLLREIAESAAYRDPWPLALASEVFGDKYYARSSRPSDMTVQLEIDRLERHWRDEGKSLVPGYFREFGVLNAEDEICRVQEKAAQESKETNQRRPTTAEREAIRLLSGVLRDLAPEVMAVFDRGTTSYIVARTEVVLGQLKSGRSYSSREVFLGESVFVHDFPEALATFLHEHAHIFGYDASRGLTDALTRLLEMVVRYRRDLDPYEARWDEARAAVRRERAEAGTGRKAQDVKDWLAKLDEDELRQLVADLPPVLLEKWRSNRT